MGRTIDSMRAEIEQLETKRAKESLELDEVDRLKWVHQELASQEGKLLQEMSCKNA